MSSVKYAAQQQCVLASSVIFQHNWTSLRPSPQKI